MAETRDGPALDGRVAVVTGGAAGIGAATARLLARCGAVVVIADTNEERSDSEVDDIEHQGGTGVSVPTDVRDPDQVVALAERVHSQYGRVDILVNNVGHWVDRIDFAQSTPELWDELYQVNLLHVIRVTRTFLPGMLEQRSGVIINVSSVEGLRGYPGDPVYAAFKAGVVHFTTSLAVQVGNGGVRVNGIAPDVTDSRQVPYSRMVPDDQQHMWPVWVPVGRMGRPEDQARVIAFLASDEASFLNGVTIPTDGGTLAAGGWFRSTGRDGGWTNRPRDP